MTTSKRKFSFSISLFFIYLFIMLFSFVCLYPFLIMISGSFSTSVDTMKYGFSIVPRHFTAAAYSILLANIGSIANSYKITITVTVVGTILSLVVNSMMGFVLSRKKVKFKRFMNIYVLITMLFSGGMVPWYIICVHYLQLKNTIFALILPYVVSAWYIFLIRNYFNSVPEEMYESATMDGASDFLIFRKIYMHLATPVLATVVLFSALAFWNDWWLGLMLTDNNNLQPLQLLLRTITANIQFLQSTNASPETQKMLSQVPTQGVQMAMVIITTGPIILLYPFVQKYFVKGIMIGAVKG
ncbi:MAG TPA: carbohydrate ABC transporter permease [Ruminiclostridium sp.]